MEGKVCGKCGIWKPLEEYHKDETKKDGRGSKCKECKKQYNKRYYKDNAERRKEQQKQVKEVKEGMKKCTKCGERKPLREFNKDKTKKDGRRSQCKECKKAYAKQYRKDNIERIKERNKQYRKDNAEYYKQYRQDNAENNLQHISSIVEQVSPIFKQLNLPIYGYIYKFENVKTGHVYIGQTIKPLKTRYGQEGGIIKSWIKERKEKQNQKFIDELIEEDFIVTEMLDVACCQYHLDKLEVCYIDKYGSYNNGYNNTAGNHITNDGIEEFIEILQQYNLEFIDGKIVKKTN